jgi:hypothetical protein
MLTIVACLGRSNFSNSELLLINSGTNCFIAVTTEVTDSCFLAGPINASI